MTHKFSKNLMVRNLGSAVSVFDPVQGAGLTFRGMSAHLFSLLRSCAGEEGPIGERELARIAGDAAVGLEQLKSFSELLIKRRLLVPHTVAEGERKELRRSLALRGASELVPLFKELLSAVWGELWDTTERGAKVDLIVALENTAGTQRLRELNRAALRSRVPFLSVRVLASSLEIGPLVLPGRGACFECYVQRLEAGSGRPPEWIHDVQAHSADGLRELYTGCALRHVGLEVARFMYGEPAAPVTLSAVIEHNLADMSLSRHPLLEVPRCPACALADGFFS